MAHHRVGWVVFAAGNRAVELTSAFLRLEPISLEWGAETGGGGDLLARQNPWMAVRCRRPHGASSRTTQTSPAFAALDWSNPPRHHRHPLGAKNEAFVPPRCAVIV